MSEGGGAIWCVGSKRLILTVTPGRSGTGYLSHLFQGIPGLFCGHEPHPTFGLVMRDVQAAPHLATGFLLETKLPAIRKIQCRTYFETSHLASKGFIEPLVANGIAPDLVILKRDPILVATSLYRLNTIPGRTATGLRWYLSPSDPTVAPLDHWGELHDWALCFWYCKEMERRMRVYTRLVEQSGARTLETSIERLQEDEGLAEMASFLGVSFGRDIEEPTIVARRQIVVNSKAERKEFHARGPLSPEMIKDLSSEVDSRMGEVR